MRRKQGKRRTRVMKKVSDVLTLKIIVRAISAQDEEQNIMLIKTEL